MAERLGIFRIEVETVGGTAHWGPAFTDRDEAEDRLPAARKAPDVSNPRVVELVGSESGKTAKWEQVD